VPNSDDYDDDDDEEDVEEMFAKFEGVDVGVGQGVGEESLQAFDDRVRRSNRRRKTVQSVSLADDDSNHGILVVTVDIFWS